MSCESMKRQERSSTAVKDIIHITYTQGTQLLSRPFSRTRVNTIQLNDIDEALFTHPVGGLLP